MSDELIDPQAEGQPKIQGYKKHSQEAIDLVNRIKDVENQLGDLVAEVRETYTPDPSGEGPHTLADPRMVALAVTNAQQSFMWLVRSIFQPDSRLK